jgi:phosphate transport system substrate-binding protein
MVQLLKRAGIAMFTSLAIAGTCYAETRLQGAGATFPNPIYQKWVTEYQKANPDVKIDYQSIGSGGGIKGITEHTIDFAGSDAPMNKKEKEAAKDPIVHIPTVAGAVVPAYNLPGFTGDLKLTGPVLTDIFSGKITKWNDPKIVEANSGASLPNMDITVAYRTDGSGTTFVFSSYLATQSEEFKSTIGASKQVKWPVGQGGKGNDGVTAIVQAVPGAIGYIEVNYAMANKIPFALMQNKSGKFVKASLESIAAAGAGAVDSMKDSLSLAVNIWDQPGEGAYPISAFTYIIVYKDLSYLKSPENAKELVKFLKWATGDEGQSLASSIDYAPLAAPVKAKAVEAIDALTFGGAPLK